MLLLKIVNAISSFGSKVNPEIVSCLTSRLEEIRATISTGDNVLHERIDNLIATDHIHLADYNRLADEVRRNSNRLSALEARDKHQA